MFCVSILFCNFKVVESTKYRPVSNENKITFVYNTKVKEMKGASDNFSDYYFELLPRIPYKNGKKKTNNAQVCS
jgi:hypothetical protein